MKYQDNLVLDHYYFSASEEEFEDLKKIFLQFASTNHSTVKTDSDSWEGLYLFTRGKHYFEFLNKRRPGGVGICQSMFANYTQDGKKVMEELPELPWRSFDRMTNGQLWYTALSLDKYEDIETPFNTWIMCYFTRLSGKPFQMFEYAIKEVSEVVVRANPSMREKILFNTQWMKCELKEKSSGIDLKIQTYYMDDFHYKIIFDEKVEKFELQCIKMKLEEGFKAHAMRLENYSLQVHSRDIVLIKNKYFTKSKVNSRINKTEAIMAKKKATKKTAKKTTKKATKKGKK